MVMVKRPCDYYYQVTGQLALIGTQFFDFIVWTEVDMRTKQIKFDAELRDEAITGRKGIISG